MCPTACAQVQIATSQWSTGSKRSCARSSTRRTASLNFERVPSRCTALGPSSIGDGIGARGADAADTPAHGTRAPPPPVLPSLAVSAAGLAYLPSLGGLLLSEQLLGMLRAALCSCPWLGLGLGLANPNPNPSPSTSPNLRRSRAAEGSRGRAWFS
mgnify:CR=1 FL=1